MINLPSQLNYYSRNECQPSNRDKVHCTARFCHRNEAEANLEYISRPEVIQSLGAMFKILVIGFVITKDTLGTEERVSTFIYTRSILVLPFRADPKNNNPTLSKKRLCVKKSRLDWIDMTFIPNLN